MDSARAGVARHASLLTAGAICTFLIPLLYVVEVFTFSGMPEDAEGWLKMFARSRVEGLFYINALDIVSISLMIVMIVALYRVFAAASPSLSSAAAPLGIVGAAVFLASRWDMTLGSVHLGDLYAAAETQERRDALVAATEAIGAPGQATPLSSGFLLITAGIVLFALAMLRAGAPWRVAGISGLVAGGFIALANIALALSPEVSNALMVLGGPGLIVFWISTGIALLKVGKRE
jgi:hypothetical protein